MNPVNLDLIHNFITEKQKAFIIQIRHLIENINIVSWPEARLPGERLILLNSLTITVNNNNNR
jgi:hypothetical protein